uniref:Transcription factor bHLH35 n=1 Tax=Nothapodytes nimmoniana TaxID=159386 RepID=A0A9E8Z836_NOTNI|nr:transcription factor bHLH35 [Nothapodytes nimmoniana]
MEELHGPIRQFIYGADNLDVESVEQESWNGAVGLCCYSQFGYAQSLGFEKEDDEAFHELATASLDDRTPFLQLLQNAESPAILPFKEPSGFQVLLKLQHDDGQTQIPSDTSNSLTLQAMEPESCVTHDVLEIKDYQKPLSASCADGVSSVFNKEQPKSLAKYQRDGHGRSGHCSPSPAPKNKQLESRKRKRTRNPKNKEEVESQRKTHIAVERNRRRRMNDHLSVLRSLMPPFYVRRGDQASIIGGAIEFVKKLEQLFQSLEAEKRMRKMAESGIKDTVRTSKKSNKDDGALKSVGEEMMAENRSSMADVRVTVIRNHVNLRVQCGRRPGQLPRAIVALEDLRLTVLHLNVTSLVASVHYCFSLKVIVIPITKATFFL